MFLRLIFIPVFLLFFVPFSIAQNLVLNGDFETFSDCPNGLDQFIDANGWFPYRGTPDYFNSCDTTNYVGTPLNITNGFQYPLSGNGYGGLIGLSYNNDREIMGTELTSPLSIGQSYYVEFYWSRTFGGLAHNNCNCASSYLGALFTTEAYNNMINPIPVTNYAQVYDPELLADSTDWVKISGWFTADSAYTHLAIGDFFDLDSNEVAYYNGSAETLALKTYYYIEDVCVATDPAMCGLVNVPEIKSNQNALRLFPNPAESILNINTSLVIKAISIIDVNSRKLYEQNTSSKQIDISGLTEGIYILIVDTNRGILRKKFIKINS